MIIDPYDKGVYIWTDSNVTSIKGNIISVCEEIYTRVVQPRETEIGNFVYDQIYELYIDIGGIGRSYKDYLTEMGLSIHELRYRNVDTVLPIRCKCVPVHIEKIADIKPAFWRR